MIQFNLLPDIKLQYIRAERNKRMVITIASLVTAISVAAVIGLSLAVFFFQRQHMNDLSADITKYTRDLNSTDDVNKILTVQNQLATLNGLHAQKQDTTRVFPFIKEVTPTDVSISSLVIDFEEQTMIVTGSVAGASVDNKLASVNKFVDTLKFTNYTREEETKKAFSEVVLASFGRADKDASYSISLKFDPTIFDNTETVNLNVPSRVTTRSETEKPGALFETSKQTNGAQ